MHPGSKDLPTRSCFKVTKNSLLTADPFIFLPSTYTEKKCTFMSSKINKKKKEAEIKTRPNFSLKQIQNV